MAETLKWEVAVIGVAAVDAVALVEHLPRADELVPAFTYNRYAGGSGANVAVGLAHLGHPVGFIGELGEDDNGRILLQSFAHEGVDTSRCRILAGQSSATCFITLAQNGERSIVALGGAGLTKQVTAADLEAIRKARLLYITDHDGELVQACLQSIRSTSTQLVYAPGGMIAARGLENMAPILAGGPILLLSLRELFSLLGESDLEHGVATLALLGAQTVIVTLGARGQYVYEHGKGWYGPAVPNPQVVDTTGGGDAFAAGLLDGLLRDLPMAMAVETGAWVASIKVGFRGARNGLPTREELLARQNTGA